MKKIYRILSLTVIGITLAVLTSSAQNAWINEIHYNDFGTDTNEFIEVIIDSPGNYVLSSFGVVLYNGNNGMSYDTKTLDLFTVGESFEMYTVYYYMYPTNGIQNGEPDGMALIYDETVIPGQFLSYEGTFTAADGPASGMTSEDIGVLETGELEGLSLQLAGQGSEYLNFTWQAPADETPGELNNAQDLLPIGIGETGNGHFSPYPNPNTGNFTILNPGNKDGVVTVYSVSGQNILEINIFSGENKVSLDVPEGIYLLHFMDNEGKLHKTERMIIR